MTLITDDGIERHDENEVERVVELVSSSASSQDDGDVTVWVHAHEEPWVVKTGMRLTEDDALELSDSLREAVMWVTGIEPQGFIRLRLYGDSPTRVVGDSD